MPIFEPLFTNAVQSPVAPYIADALPVIVSTNCPMVIREGIAWGLIIKSGRIPSAVNGISRSGITKPIVPFCPALDAILSPIFGIRSSRTRTLAIRVPISPSVINVLSTIPSCPFFGVFDASIFLSGLAELDDTIPIKTVFSLISVFSLIIP